MRLLLDEMFPPEAARALREGSHDVIAVVERAELVGQTDTDLFDAAQRDRRAVVTENVVDFVAIDAGYRESGRDHFGLLFVRKDGLPRKRAQFVGALVRLLDAWLTEHPDPAASSFIAWP